MIYMITDTETKKRTHVSSRETAEDITHELVRSFNLRSDKPTNHVLTNVTELASHLASGKTPDTGNVPTICKFLRLTVETLDY